MIYLTEQQRLAAIKACEGIEAAIEKQQQAFKNIIEILEKERASLMGDPMAGRSGVKP